MEVGASQPEADFILEMVRYFSLVPNNSRSCHLLVMGLTDQCLMLPFVMTRNRSSFKGVRCQSGCPCASVYFSVRRFHVLPDACIL